MDKKGALGLNIVKAVLLVLIVLAVLAVAGMLVSFSMRDVADDIDLVDVTATNEQTTDVNETGADLDYREVGELYRSSACTISSVTNETGGAVNSNNYTTSNEGCTVAFTGADTAHNDSSWYFNYTAEYVHPRTTDIASNYTDSVVDFFEENGTIISILVVVIIIAAIGIVILIISKFGAGGAGGGLKSGKGKSYGSDTVMGV